jgi:serine protease Do
VETVMPAVVVVRTEAVEYDYQKDWFGFIFRVPKRLAGQGSGILIDPRGFVLTSRHVIAGSRRIEVVLNDGRKRSARYVGCDPVTDLAVIRVEGPEEAFPVIAYGDSDRLRVGETVIAIGSPFSLQSSVTVGTVSQKGRELGLLPYEDFIQTDAPINPGNSGGPLVNVDGELVGINSAIKTDENGHGNIGIAFAVPARLAMRVASEMMKGGCYEWPWLGLNLADMDALTGSTEDRIFGVPIVEVWNKTPGQRAGLLPGDVIVEADGRPVQTAREVHRLVLGKEVGSPVLLKINRSGRIFELELKTVKMPERFKICS